MRMWNASRTRRRRVPGKAPNSPRALKGYRRPDIETRWTKFDFATLCAWATTRKTTVRNTHGGLAAVLVSGMSFPAHVQYLSPEVE